MRLKEKKELLKRATDANAYTKSDGDSENINPEVWVQRIREFQEKNLVLTQFAEMFDFTGQGGVLDVTIDEEPAAANGLTETSDVAIETFNTRQVSFDPDEQGAAYQVTRKEAARSFFDIAERMTRKLGYATARRKDDLAATEIYNNANVSVFVGDGNSAQGDLSAGDTLSLDAILEARRKIQKNQYAPDVMVVTWEQEEQVLNINGVQRASDFGGSEAIREGTVGTLFGIQIVAADSADVDAGVASDGSDVSKAILLGETRTGEAALGHAQKRNLIIEREYHARGRYWDVVAHEEYDFQLLHPDAAAVVHSTNS